MENDKNNNLPEEEIQEKLPEEKKHSGASRKKPAGASALAGSLNLPGIIITALFVLVEGWFFLRLNRTQLLPAKFMWPIGIGLAVLAALVGWLCWNHSKKGKYISGAITAMVICTGLVIGASYVDRAYNTIRNMEKPTDADSTVNWAVFVRADDSAQTLDDIKADTIGILDFINREQADIVLEEIRQKVKGTVTVKTYMSPLLIEDGLLNGEVRAILIEEDSLGAVSGDESILQKVRKLSTHPVEKDATKSPDDTPGYSEVISTPEEIPSTAPEETTTQYVEPITQTYRDRPTKPWDSDRLIDPDATTPDPDETTTEEPTTEEPTTAKPTQPTTAKPTQPTTAKPTQPTQPRPTQPTQPTTAVPTATTDSSYITVPEGQGGRIFTVYLGGMDSRTGWSSRGNTDVNILACVNMNTHQILLINTPRDYFVPLPVASGRKDKLTHAGYYGLQSSIDTVSALYTVKCNYYARVFFEGFIKCIDAIGGISVYSSQAFVSSVGGYSFNAGYNDVDGAKALAFARERKSFSGGDNDRGKNQMEVIKAIIRKASSGGLNNYDSVLNAVSGLIDYSVPYDLIAAMIRSFLNGDSWNVATYAVTGTGGNDWCFSINQSNYVMYPNYDTVNYARSLIRKLYNGEAVYP